MTDWLDIALVFDPETRRTDLVFGEDGDLVLDETPATPMLIAFGSDRRARPDDELPTGVSEINAPSSFVERRGWAGDALDANGELIGSRLWLLDRAKQTEITRLLAEEWMKQAFGWVRDETGSDAAIDVVWVRKEVLRITVGVDGRSFTLNKRVAA
ncbi:phage GP46 family protein [Kaistia dalseonensis]|uniref:Phage gp46-like protein n=1 Tax=Kaistia dalseonensis TaxID=410840 RepID=A0ABU0HCC8_9HYPH|nr:phage GP46 family protein [Kaistia dalseonensis]MCX5497333.1 phage GP46 family protein [Kaistia dalseonensis]MDQ0439970.1 phage gp46-like protein [Kaistia dalseonensis]